MYKKLSTNLIVLLITIILIIILAEGGLRIYYSKTGNTIAGNEEEKCSKDLFKLISNPLTENRFSPGFTSYLEYSNYTGVRPKANLEKNKIVKVMDGDTEVNYVFHITNTNAQHMKALKNFTKEKNPGKLRVALFGDSYTWGADTLDHYSYSSILEKLIPNSEVLNFGVEGIGIDLMYLRWKYEGLQFSPDVTIFAIYVDDIIRVRPCINKPKLTRMGDKLEISNFPPPSHKEILNNFEETKIESYFLKHLLYSIDNLKGTKKKYDDGISILELLLEEMKLKSEKDNTYFMVMLIEAGNDYTNSEEELYSIEKSKEMFKKMQIPFISSKDIFIKENYVPIDISPSKTHGHFTPKGYGILAQGIRQKLEEDSIIEKQKDYYFMWRITNSSLFLINKNDDSDFEEIIPYDIIR